MTTSVKEKKVLIHIDTKGIEHVKKIITEAADSVNMFVATAEADLVRGFTDEEKVKLYEHGIHYIEADLREKYPFPAADDETNLRLMGIDLKGLRQLHKMYYHAWLRYPQKLENGRFEVIDIDELPEIEARFTYAENKKQEQAYKRAVEFCDLVNSMDGEGLLSPHAKHLIGDAAPIVALSTDEGVRKFRPNKSGIRMIRE